MSNPSLSWPDYDIKVLIVDWWSGVPASEIARRLKRSKNSIVGKAHRLNLPPRLSPIKPAGSGTAPHKHLKVPEIKAPEIKAPEPIQPEFIGKCQFPLWGIKERPPRDPAKRYCDKPVAHRRNLDGTLHWYPYCAAHCRICYQHRVARQAAAV